MGYYKSKYQHKKKQTKGGNFLFKSFIALIIIFVLYSLFIESSYIGKDYRYNIFVFWIPILIGLFIAITFNILGLDYKKIYSELKKERKIYIKIIYILLINFVLFMFSIIMFWIPSNIIWDILNKIESQKNKVEVVSIPVEKFTKSRQSNKIYFKFNNHTESIKVSSKRINQLIDKNPNNYIVEIGVKKGIWNYYVVDYLNIKLKS